MKRKYAQRFTLSLMSTLLLGLSSEALAATTWTEARGDAMGGTGVASAHYGAAALSNPALLTRYDQSDDFSLILPAVGARVSDSDNLIDGFDDIDANWDRLKATLNAGGDGSASAAALVNNLKDVSGKDLLANAGVSSVITIPNSVMPLALVFNAWGTASVRGTVTDSDLAWLDGVANGTITPTPSELDNLASYAEGRAAVVAETGIAMARELHIGGQAVSVGITPKVQRVYTFNYNAAINNYDRSDFRSTDYRNDKTGVNIDVGLSTALTEHWTLGLVGQNLVARRVETKKVNGLKDTFKVHPQATLGTAWSNGVVTGALDVDLTPASSFASEEKRQYVAVGGELNAWKWAQLRAGYRADVHNSNHNLFTAGIGLSPFDVVHLDITGMVGTSNNTYGAVAQLGFTF
ncbi:TPA: conjugal transfer protein TraF [Serratia fonticola]